MGTDANTLGCYRFLENENTAPKDLKQALYDTATKRAQGARELLAIHDTTKSQQSQLDGREIGWLNTGKPGFYIHISLLLDADGFREPLGITHCETIHRKKKPSRRKKNKPKKKASGAQTAKKKNPESERWIRGIDATIQALPQPQRAIHIMDSEGDSYKIIDHLVRNEQRFVLRCCKPRNARRPGQEAVQHVQELVQSAQGVLQRTVPLSRRKTKNTKRMNKAHPPRRARDAQLSFSAQRVVLSAPGYSEPETLPELEVNVVRVWEANPPRGEPAVEWILYTLEPIDTPEQIAKIVDHYRSRWTIEEYNSALKTGVGYEKRRLESKGALLRLLALSLPIACEVLWLRSQARDARDRPANEVLSPVRLQVLRSLSERLVSDNPTVGEAFLAIAGLGGHLKHNGPPGWKVLIRGMVDLIQAEKGWIAAMRAIKGQC